MAVDELKHRAMMLGMKSMQPGGLTPAEQEELARLRQQIAMEEQARKA
jgi:hypothetical protein